PTSLPGGQGACLSLSTACRGLPCSSCDAGRKLRSSGVDTVRGDDEGLREQRSELPCCAEHRSHPLGVFEHVLWHLVAALKSRHVLGRTVDADEVATDICHIESQSHVRVVLDVAQLSFGCLAVHKDRLVVA